MPLLPDPAARRPPTHRHHTEAFPAGAEERSGTATFLAALLGPLAIWGLAMGLAGAVASPEVPDGQCSGIGFGCTLSPRDGAWFLGLYAGVPAVAVTTTVLLLCLVAPRRFRGALVGTLLGAFACVVAVVLVAVAHGGA
ncbi:hypothetical protein [Aquihabitans sp. G128]|uniref:hypothetical protein n=1 Tax=Aquihabitans sp. G128 TaxID=2849779 RepID=UPI0020B44512|nr:hypothetical protein [Aquihabitans sp. G128]